MEARGGGRERQQSGGLAVRVAASRRAWRRCPRAAAIGRGLGNRLCATARRQRRRCRRPRAAAAHRPCRLLRAARRRHRRRRQLIVTAPGTRPAAGRAREWGGGAGGVPDAPQWRSGPEREEHSFYSNRARQERSCTGGEHAGQLQNPEMTRKPYERRKGLRQATWQRRRQK